jgi:Copper binding proteins, plastocyanin/azurin family
MRRAVVALAVLTAALVATALLAPGGRAGGNTQLFASVTSNAVILLRDAAGNRVTQIDPGTYDIVVNDSAIEHNFHLSGPGVDRATSVEETGTETWTVTFTEAVYRYVCDPHASVMRGSFTVGNPPNPPPPPPAAKPKPATKLTGTVGPGYTISLRRPNGAAVRSLKPGRYAITVRDRASDHNFHLTGAGVNRRTGVPYRGTTAKAWTVTLKRGTLRWLCDPHATQMRGSASVR